MLAPRLRVPGVLVAIAVGLSWAFNGSRDTLGVSEYLAIVSFSLGLAMLAGAAWLIAELAHRSKAAVVAAAVLAVGGLTAAVGNYIEDAIGDKAFGLMYEVGISGVILGLAGLVVVLAFGRRLLLAGLAAATLAGLMLSQTGAGGYLILAAWLTVAAALVRDRQSDRTTQAG